MLFGLIRPPLGVLGSLKNQIHAQRYLHLAIHHANSYDFSFSNNVGRNHDIFIP